MKKAIISGIILSAVLVLVIVSAGCISNPAAPTDKIDFSKLEVDMEWDIIKEGTTYNIGDTVDILLPGDSEFVTWTVTRSSDGISIEDEGFIPGDKTSSGVGSQLFTITALKEGTHDFTISMLPTEKTQKLIGEKPENFTSDIFYADSMQVVKTDAEPLTPRGVFSVTGIASHFPCIGHAVQISIAGNPSTGYQWEAQKTNGLLISEPTYTPFETEKDMVGSGGVYTWTVTSLNSGSYEFTALSTRSGDSAPAGSVVVPLYFMEEEINLE